MTVTINPYTRDMKSAQHGASPLSSMGSGRRGSDGGSDMKLRSEVEVGSGVGSGVGRHQEIQCRFRENTPPPTPTATSEVNPSADPRRPDPTPRAED